VSHRKKKLIVVSALRISQFQKTNKASKCARLQEDLSALQQT